MKLKANQLYFAIINLLHGNINATDEDIKKAYDVAMRLAEMVPEDEKEERPTRTREQASEETEMHKLDEAANIFRGYPWTPQGARWTDLDKYIRKLGIKSSRRISDYFLLATEHGIITRGTDKRFHYIGDDAKSNEEKHLF